MADFSITITNAIVSFGPAPATLWGTNTPYTMTWGSSKWGEGTADTAMDIGKVLQGQTITLGDTLSVIADFHLSLSESIILTSETTSEGLTDGSGYSYLFVGGSSDAENRTNVTYVEGSTAALTYTSQTVATTTWSQA